MLKHKSQWCGILIGHQLYVHLSDGNCVVKNSLWSSCYCYGSVLWIMVYSMLLAMRGSMFVHFIEYHLRNRWPSISNKGNDSIHAIDTYQAVFAAQLKSGEIKEAVLTELVHHRTIKIILFKSFKRQKQKSVGGISAEAPLICADPAWCFCWLPLALHPWKHQLSVNKARYLGTFSHHAAVPAAGGANHTKTEVALCMLSFFTHRNLGCSHKTHQQQLGLPCVPQNLYSLLVGLRSW